MLTKLARERGARGRSRGLVDSLREEMEYHVTGADGSIMRKAAERLASFGAQVECLDDHPTLSVERN